MCKYHEYTLHLLCKMQQKLLFEELLDMVLQQENVFSDYTVQ